MPFESIRSANENTVIETPTSGRDTESSKILILYPEVLAKLCRLCLEEKPPMWSFLSVLTFNDGSMLDVPLVFQDLTKEESDKIEQPELPQFICEQCLNLLISAHTFQQKYKESTEILSEYLAKKLEENDKNESVYENIELDVDQHATNQADNEIGLTQNNNGSDFQPSSDVNASQSVVIKENDSQLISAEKITLSATDIEKIDVSNRTNEEIDHFASATREATTKVPSAPRGSTSEKLHRCPICPKYFTALRLKKHCHTHKTLKTYLKAATKYVKKVKFYATPRTEKRGLFNQETILHTCPFCQEEFESEPFIEHIKLHRSEGNFKCNICNRIFLGINHLKTHQLSHKKEAPFKCNMCTKAFFLKKNYNFHLLKHRNELNFKCEYCEKTFSNPEHLKRHRFNHENDLSYSAFYKREMLYVKCKQCQQKFKSIDERDTHSCKLCCAKCRKLFESKNKFNSHICKRKLKNSQCSRCKRVFQLPSSLEAHKCRCATRILCYVCGKNVTNMTSHLATHYPNRGTKTSFKCAQCNKLFSFKAGLKRHISQVHMNIVHYQCQYCSKGFKAKWNLHVHERIHLGVKPHVCAICNKGFLEKSYLQKHLKVH